MQINFSVISEGLARTYGDAECIVNVERIAATASATTPADKSHREHDAHRLDLRRGDAWLSILHNDNLSLLSFFTAFKERQPAATRTPPTPWRRRRTRSTW